MQKEIIVLSDTEMGAGNLTDDFISDNALSSLIFELCEREHPVDLVLNGDTFDFLKCPASLQHPTYYPRHITESVSCQKLDLMHQAHPLVFEALRTFATKQDKNLFFVRGNHDPDLAFPAVQKRLQELLGNGNVHFPGLTYQKHDVHIEHGQQYDPMNKLNQKKLFLNYKDEKILNLPLMSFFVISLVNLKEQHPFLERVKPITTLFGLHKELSKKFNQKAAYYLLKSSLYYPWRYYKDPTHFYPSGWIGKLVAHLQSGDFDVKHIIPVVKRKKSIKSKLVVLGHVHEDWIVTKNGRVFMQLPPWRDEYTLDRKTKELVPCKKGYVRIKVLDNDELEWNLIHLPEKRSRFLFKDVKKDEHGFLTKAKEEELWN